VSAFVSLSLPLSAVDGAILVTHVVKTIFILVVRDKPLAKGILPRFNLGAFPTGFWIIPVKYPDFAWAWLTRFLVFMSYSTSLVYLLFFLQDAVHYLHAAQGVATFQIIITGTFLISFFIICGILSDKFQRRKIFVTVASLVLAIAFPILAFFHLWLAVEVAAAVVGIGFGAYLGVDIALITQVLPSARKRDKDLGVINIANAFPQVMSPEVAAFAIITFHSYTVLFILGTILALLGALLVQRMKGVR
jgi:MFS family permease